MGAGRGQTGSRSRVSAALLIGDCCGQHRKRLQSRECQDSESRIVVRKMLQLESWEYAFSNKLPTHLLPTKLCLTT